MKLIFVHGRDQQNKNPIELRAQWETALKVGVKNAGLNWPNNTEILFPFYGDTLAEMVEQLKTPLIDDVVTKGATQDTKEASFRGEFLEELRKNAGITDDQIEQYYRPEVSEKGVLNWEWVQAILKVLDETWVGESSIDLFTRDVYVYLTNSNVRKAIDSIVTQAITGGPCVIVGHSLGSIVAFNILRTLGDNANVKRYVTVGSPLGVKAIQRLLTPPALVMPTGVKDWFNAYDERDVVALRALDSQNFPIHPPVTNKSNVNNHTDNRHGIVGYLDDPEVAKWIHKELV